MLYFENDYCEGAHPAILQKLTETNFEKVSGYGTDPYCASAREKIRAACACPEADVQFISGGTQSNAIVIASMLQRWAKDTLPDTVRVCPNAEELYAHAEEFDAVLVVTPHKTHPALRQTTAVRRNAPAFPSAIIWAYLRPMTPVPITAARTSCMMLPPVFPQCVLL